MRKREALEWVPSFDGALRGWTKKFIAQNMWRCDGIHSFDDLMQDAYIIFARIAYSYPRVTEAANFMALYKTAVVNDMHDKARYKRRKRERHVETTLDVSEVCADHVGEVTHEGYLRVLLDELPTELKVILAAFEDEEKLEQMQQPRPRTKLEVLAGLDGVRENFNMRMRRILGIDGDGDQDFAGQIQQYFSNT